MHKVRYLRVVLTERCNLNCFFCHREGCDNGAELSEISLEEMYEYIVCLVQSGIRKIKFMGGEPTLYPHLCELICRLKSYDNNIDISIITNGIVSEKILAQVINAGIDRVNVSLHGYDKTFFSDITGGTEKQLDQIFNSIKYLDERKVLGKINYVLLKGINEEEFYKVLEYIHENNYLLDVLNYLGEDLEKINQYQYDLSEIERIICNKYNVISKCTHDNPYSIPSKRLILESGGIINLKVNKLRDISFLQSCKSCTKKMICDEGISAIRLTNKGIIQPCLFRDDLTFDVRKLMQINGREKMRSLLNDYLIKL